MDAVRLELGDVRRYPLRLDRNNVGQMIDKDGRRVVFGLGKGSADLVGCWQHSPFLACPQCACAIPFGIGQYVELEIKTPDGQQSPEQVMRQALVTKRGGVYAVIRSVDEARQWAENMRSTK